MADSYIDNIETNNMNFKHLETTKDIIISPKNEYGDPQRPDATHTWTAKVSDGTNFVGDYAVKINGASLIVDSEDFTKLPVGKYTLEVWEQWTDDDGTSELSIYPSPKQTIPFTIYANIADQADEEIKKIGFQDVVDQAVMNIGMNYVFKVNTIEPDQNATVVQSAADGKNYVTFNIPRGQTGEQGFRGPAGKNFHIQQTFASVKDMEASQGKGFEDGDFALIASDVNDPDNSKFYVWSDANKKFTYMDDLSGAQGIQGPVGPAPTLHVTKVTTVPNGEQPSFTATSVGNGNYNIEIGLPKGDTPKRGVDYWTDADKQAIKDDVTKTVGDAFATNALNGITTNAMHWTRLDLTGEQYDPNKWYPVTSSNSEISNLTKITVKGDLYKDYAKWGTHSMTNDSGLHGFSVFKQIQMNHNGWGAANVNAYLEADNHSFDGNKSPAYFDQVIDKNCYLVWLRGGATYTLGISMPKCNWSIHTDEWKTTYETYLPTNNEPSDLASLISALKKTGQQLNFVDFTTLSTTIQSLKNKLGGE